MAFKPSGGSSLPAARRRNDRDAPRINPKEAQDPGSSDEHRGGASTYKEDMEFRGKHGAGTKLENKRGMNPYFGNAIPVEMDEQRLPSRGLTSDEDYKGP